MPQRYNTPSQTDTRLAAAHLPSEKRLSTDSATKAGPTNVLIPFSASNEGCAVFAVDVIQAAGLRRPNIRYDHDLPQVYRINGLVSLTLWTPGTANARRARKISFEYPDALADKYLSNAPFKAGG